MAISSSSKPSHRMANLLAIAVLCIYFLFADSSSSSSLRTKQGTSEVTTQGKMKAIDNNWRKAVLGRRVLCAFLAPCDNGGSSDGAGESTFTWVFQVDKIASNGSSAWIAALGVAAGLAAAVIAKNRHQQRRPADGDSSVSLVGSINVMTSSLASCSFIKSSDAPVASTSDEEGTVISEYEDSQEVSLEDSPTPLPTAKNRATEKVKEISGKFRDIFKKVLPRSSCNSTCTIVE